jgi:hypothetical protein
MKPEVTAGSPECVQAPADQFELGTWIGRRQAFNVVAARASAADVDCLRQIRESRIYKCKAASWGEFCENYLGASKASVNRLISCLEKFGPKYFSLTQLTRVSPRVFEAIAPHLTDDGLTVDGETFALTAENTDQIAAAVVELRKRVEAEPPAPQKTPFEAVEKRFEDLIGRLASAAPELDEEQRAALGSLMARLQETASAAGLLMAA